MPARACRGCLATDCRLYNIYKNNLYEAFGDVLGSPIFESEDLPQHICSMCFAQLSNYVSFRNRCRLAQEILEDLNLQGIKLTTRFIRNIDRSKCNLLLNLKAVTLTAPDMIIQEEIPDEVQQDVPPPVQSVPESKEAESSALEHVDDFPVDPIPPLEIASEIPIMLPPKPEKLKKPKKLSIFEDPKKTKAFEETHNMDVVFLTKEEQIEEVKARILHSATRVGDFPYCSDCGQSCRSEETLQKHISLLHEESVGDACEICRCRFPKKQLPKHLYNHGIKISCKQCDFTTKSTITATSHAREHGLLSGKSFRKYPCELCKQVFEKKFLLNKHIWDDHPNKLQWCICCGETALNKSGMHAHMRSAHVDFLKSEHQCQKCSSKFVSSEALVKHSELTCDGFHCVMCGDRIESNALLKEHVVKQHARSKFIKLAQCSDCGVKFFGSAPLTRHLQEMSCGVGSPCKECGESFPSEEAMEVHKVEFHPKLYRSCESCDKAFDADNYRHHIQRVHSIKPPVYQRGYHARTSATVWSVRGNIITGEAAARGARVEPNTMLICHVCGKTFSKYAYLRIHMRQHTGEKPYSCKICPKGYTKNQGLQDHMRLHSGERPYVCHVCPKSFRRRISLTRHLLCHSEVRRHICHLCGKKFRTSTSAKIHIKGVHLNLPVRRLRNRRKRVDTLEDTENLNNQDFMDSETNSAVNNILPESKKRRADDMGSDQNVDTRDVYTRDVDSISNVITATAKEIVFTTINKPGRPKKIKPVENIDAQTDGIVIDTFSDNMTAGVTRIIKTINIKRRKPKELSIPVLKNSDTYSQDSMDRYQNYVDDSRTHNLNTQDYTKDNSINKQNTASKVLVQNLQAQNFVNNYIREQNVVYSTLSKDVMDAGCSRVVKAVNIQQRKKPMDRSMPEF